MKLATLHNGERDGRLVVVARDLETAALAPPPALTMQSAVERWEQVEQELRALFLGLNQGTERQAFALATQQLMAPLPRAYQFLDGSAYYHHMSVVRRARGAEPPPDFFDKPLMYQGPSDPFLGPHEPLRLLDDERLGVDIEAEIAVITGDVQMGVATEAASRYIRLLVLLNDYSLRSIIPGELSRGFGFLQGKCASSLGPIAVTPDEAGEAWNGKLLRGRYHIEINGKRLGDLQPAADASFTYPQLISHAAHTRELRSGTVIGAGALANQDHERHGSGCIAEQRAHETIQFGGPRTDYLRFGDRVRLELFDAAGASLFGAIDQTLERYSALAAHGPDQTRPGERG